MKVSQNPNLIAVRPVMTQLLAMLNAEYDYASLLATDSRAMSYSCSKRGMNVSEIPFLAACGYVLRVYDRRGCCEYSFNELTHERIPEILEVVKTRLVPLSDKLPDGLSFCERLLPDDEELSLSKSSEYAEDPELYGDDKILALLEGIHKLGLSTDERVIECVAGCNYQRYSKLFLSKNRELEQNILWCNGQIYAMAKTGEAIKDCYRGFSALGGLELLDTMRESTEAVCKVAVELLSSEPMIPGEYECVCTPEVTGMIVHEAFGHGVEMDMFVKDRAQAKLFIDKPVASKLVNMRDSACAVEQTASFFFDDEGVCAKDTVIIENGILKGGICDAQSAMHLGLKPTGNGRRESYARKAYTRMTNTWFMGGDSTPEEMIASVKYGFLLDNPTSGMEDPKNWGIQCMVNFAREIADGKFTGRIFSPIVLTGYVPDLLKSISMMSKEVELSGTGFCGKGYKEWVKVSDGGPWIKAKIRLG